LYIHLLAVCLFSEHGVERYLRRARLGIYGYLDVPYIYHLSNAQNLPADDAPDSGYVRVLYKNFLEIRHSQRRGEAPFLEKPKQTDSYSLPNAFGKGYVTPFADIQVAVSGQQNIKQSAHLLIAKKCIVACRGYNSGASGISHCISKTRNTNAICRNRS
jgi:hypothetical protein